MSDLNQILDEILNNPLYSTGEGNPAEAGKIDERSDVRRTRTESDSRVRASNDEVPNSDESDDDDVLDQSDAPKNPVEESEELLQRNLQPRRLRRKSEENVEEDDSQHVPNVQVPEKGKAFPDDENNRDHPTYVPRKGKFFEHDDRTSNEPRATKQ